MHDTVQRWIQSEQDYKTVVDIFEKAHQAGVLTALGEDVRKRMALVWEDAEGHWGRFEPPLGVRQHRGIAERMFQNYPEVFKGSPALSCTLYRGVAMCIEYGCHFVNG